MKRPGKPLKKRKAESKRPATPRTESSPCLVTSGAAHPLMKNYFGYSLYKSAMRMRTMLDKKLEPLDIIAPQIGIIRLILSSETAPTQNELGTHLSIDGASMVKFLDHLELKGYVTRTPCEIDRRSKRVEITSKGKKIMDHANEIRISVEEEFLKPLSNDEKKWIRDIIPKLLPDFNSDQ